MQPLSLIGLYHDEYYFVGSQKDLGLEMIEISIHSHSGSVPISVSVEAGHVIE